MYFILMMIVFVAGVAIGIAIKIADNQRSTRADRLSKRDKQRLVSAENTLDTIQELATDHLSLDPTLPSIVLDEIRNHRRAVDR